MFKGPDTRRYVEDIEFIRNLDFINTFGINLQNQTKRPYINTYRVIIPDDFSFDNINNLYYINDVIGRTEFIIFNKCDTHIELTQYKYTGFDYDKSKTPSVQLRNIVFEDTNNLFKKYFEESNLTIEEFFKMRMHFTFLQELDIPSTYINVFKVPGFDDKFKYSIINSEHDDYLNMLKDNLCGNRCDIYSYMTRVNHESMMEIASSFLENQKIRYITAHSYRLAR